MIKEKKVWGIIFGGGNGSRFNSKIPKQYINLNGKPVIQYVITTFNNSNYIDEIIVCVQKKWINFTSQLSYEKKHHVVEAGENSHLTKLKGLEFIKTSKNVSEKDIVVFCDAVRPNVTTECLDETVESTYSYGSGVCRELSTEHVMKENEDDGLIGNKYYVVKAPQSFILEDVLKMYNTVDFEKYVDTCSAMNTIKNIHYVQSSENNVKITTEKDLSFLQTICK